MPCYRCGTRQVDPDRGESPWKRGVRRDSQVLICPGCQGAFDWAAELDRCATCGGIRLVRRLGEVECRDCGWVRDPGPGPEPSPVPGPEAQAQAAGGPAAPQPCASLTPGLAEEVEQALARVLGKVRRPAGISSGQ